LHELRERALAAPRRAHDRHASPGLDRQAERLEEERQIGRVTEAEASDLNPALSFVSRAGSSE
jgi:hypothetical protein